MDNVKTGFASSEFYITLITQVVGILSVAGVIDPAHSSQLVQAMMTVIGGILTIVPALVYIYQRTWLKSRSIPQATVTL